MKNKPTLSFLNSSLVAFSFLFMISFNGFHEYINILFKLDFNKINENGNCINLNERRRKILLYIMNNSSKVKQSTLTNETFVITYTPWVFKTQFFHILTKNYPCIIQENLVWYIRCVFGSLRKGHIWVLR